LVIAGIAAAGLTLGVTAAWASQWLGSSAADGPDLAVSTLTGEPGDLVEVEGTGCPPEDPTESVGDWEVQVWFDPVAGAVDEPGLVLGEPIAYLTPQDGEWATELRVPEWPVEYRLEAACFDGATPPNGFVYEALLFDATGAPTSTAPAE
jgi:hypothetical protein